MGHGRHLVPGDVIAPAVGAEHRAGGVQLVPLRVIADLLHDLLGVVAGLIAPQGAGQPPAAPGVGGDRLPIVSHPRHRGKAGEQGHVPLALGRLHRAPHGLDVRHGPAHALGGHLQGKVVKGLQQNALGLHQALAHRPIGGLAEVAPLGVLLVGSAGQQGDLHVGEGGAGEHPRVVPLQQMGENQPLPVQVQLVGGAGGGQLHPAAPGTRLQQEMDLGIVAQRFEVTDALHRAGDGLPIQHPARAEVHF